MPTFRERILEITSLSSPNKLRDHLISVQTGTGGGTGLPVFSAEPVDISVGIEEVNLGIELSPVDISVGVVTAEVDIVIEANEIDVDVEEIDICLS